MAQHESSNPARKISFLADYGIITLILSRVCRKQAPAQNRILGYCDLRPAEGHAVAAVAGPARAQPFGSAVCRFL